MSKKPVNRSSVRAVEMLTGIFRKTLVYNNNMMLCHFSLDKNSSIPLHSHKEHQIGYVITGKLQFETETGNFLVGAGDSYVFESSEKHGATILEDSEVIDVFSPSRDDYK
ncbi:MAG: cupin domain-containing protein [Candidatus Lokiarchaeota archaeon]|nr:cupin domain-containing protein [Candidatus Lokiarchaeota archaeon]